jgi:hypothetical protein
MGNFSIPLLGMARAWADLDHAATRIAHAPHPATTPPSDQIDLSVEIVALLQVPIDLRANVKSAQALDDNTRTLLDLLP